MKIAVATTFPVYPTHGGNRARLKSLIETLSRQGHEVDLLLLGSRQLGEFDRSAHQRELAGRFQYLERPWSAEFGYLCSRGARSLGRRLRAAAGSKVHPLDHVDEIFFDGFIAPLRRLFHERQFDAVVVQYVTLSKVLTLTDPGTLRVIDTHDTFSFSLSPKQERRGLLRADVVLAIQDEEAAVFRKMLKGYDTDVVVVSHITERVNPICVKSSMGATFFGSAFAANRSAVAYFIDEVLPRILNAAPSFELSVAGAIADEVPNHPAVRKIGPVDNVAQAFADYPLLVNPTREGTGVKVKLLEAMARGVPAVSTELGVRGIAREFLGGVEVTSDGDAAGFADAVLRVVRNTAWREELSHRALAAARSWNERQTASLRRLFSRGDTPASATSQK